jgi:hypothetical protein
MCKKTDLILDQLIAITRKNETNFVSFSDEALSPRILKELSTKIIQNNIDIKWFTFARLEHDFTDYAFCELLYKAGCRVLMFGLESIDKSILNAMRKGIEPEDVSIILKNCGDANIAVRLDIMLGYPGETKEQAISTINYLLNNKEVIDRSFSVTPLSKFELQKDSILKRSVENEDGAKIGKSRGNLDYCYDYTSVSGMSSSDVDKVYANAVTMIKKYFKYIQFCPDNKTHAFLMKSYENVCDNIFIDLDDIYSNPKEFTIFLNKGTIIKDVENESYLLVNLFNNAQLRISSDFKKAIDMLTNSGIGSHIDKEVIEILFREDFLSIQKKDKLLCLANYS